MTPTQHGILRALYWTQDDMTVTLAKVAFYSKYSKSSSTFMPALRALQEAGLADGLRITAAGAALIGPKAGVKPRGAQLREWLRPILKPTENAMLDVLIGSVGKTIDEEEMAAQTGYSRTSSTFRPALKRLCELEAAVDGGTRAAEVFFE